MTKVLAIEGTDIRVEIEDCVKCSMHDGEFGCCNLAVDIGIKKDGNDAQTPCCPLDGNFGPPTWCPLPDKKEVVHKKADPLDDLRTDNYSPPVWCSDKKVN